MDEILVHVSGPSTVSDDARYRAQVAAIRDYLLTTNDQQRSPGEKQVSASESASSQDAARPPGDQRRDLSSSQPPSLNKHSRDRLSLDSLLRVFEISDEADNDDEPVHEPQPNPIVLSPQTSAIRSALQAPRDPPRQIVHDSLESLVSVIPDSQPELVSLSLQEESDSALLLQGASPPRHRLEDDSPQSRPPKRRRIQDENDGELCASTDGNAGTSPHTQEATTSSPSPLNTSQKAISISNHKPPRTPQTLLKNTPLQIRPPQPPISTTPFTTHKTPTLSLLEQRLNPSRTYKPTVQTRTLDILERGYWAVRIVVDAGPSDDDNGERKSQPCQFGTWSPTFFSRFWGFLSEFIGKEGRAGWGVWCFLDQVEGALASTATAGGIDAADAAGQVQARSDPEPREAVSVLLKVYTWGEIAMHIYLVLYLASERRIRGLGAQWRDSREQVVIQMR